MATVQQLERALLAADKAGDTQAARALASDLKAMLQRDRQQERDAYIKQEVTGDMSMLDKLVVGAGRGLTELGQGAKQLGLNVGAKIGLADQAIADEYNRAVAAEAADFDRDLGDSGAATTGRIGSQIIATAPLGGIGAGARGATAVARSGAIQGAIGGLLNPVTNAAEPMQLSDLVTGNRPSGGGFFEEKAKQVGLGAALGGAVGYGGQKLIDAGTGAVNAGRRAYNRVLAPQAAQAAQELVTTPGAATVAMESTGGDSAIGNAIGRIASGGRDSKASLRRGERVARDTGINLTPGQLSGGKGTTMAENLARQSIWTRDTMFQGDQTRARQMLNAINRTAKAIAPGGTSAEGFATSLQGKVRNMVTDLANARSKFGREAYGKIEQAAGGQKVIPTARLQDEIAKIVDEHTGVQGADSSAIAAQAERFFNALSGDGAISPMTALRQLQAWEKAGRTGAGLFEGVQDRSTAKTLANRLARALSDDIDNAGGNFGESLRRANAGWRDYSSKIDALEASALGRMVGEDFADDVAGVAFNRVSPEKVWQRMDALAPSELEAVRTYLNKAAPDMWKQYQRLTLERARDVARMAAPNRGSRTLALSPGEFVKALEGSSGKQAISQAGRLRVIFADSPMEKQVSALLEAGRRMADSTGTNFSGSTPAAEAMGLLGAAGNGVRAVAGAVAPAFGLKQVANVASRPAAQRRLPMLQAASFPIPLRALIPAGAIQGQNTLLERPRQPGARP